MEIKGLIQQYSEPRYRQHEISSTFRYVMAAGRRYLPGWLDNFFVIMQAFLAKLKSGMIYDDQHDRLLCQEGLAVTRFQSHQDRMAISQE